MALVLPLLLLITAGIVDLGMLYRTKSVLTNASREGARAAARATAGGAPEKTVAQVKAVVSTYLTNLHITTSLVTGGNFSYTYNTGVNPPTISVRLTSIPVNLMLLPNIQTLFSGGTVSQTINLSAQTNSTAEWDSAYTPSP